MKRDGLDLNLPWAITRAVLLCPEEPCLVPPQAERRGSLALGAEGGRRHRHHVARQRGPGGARHAHYCRKILIIIPCDRSLGLEAADCPPASPVASDPRTRTPALRSRDISDKNQKIFREYFHSKSRGPIWETFTTWEALDALMLSVGS